MIFIVRWKMRSALTLALTLLLTSLCQGECPMECYCESGTIARCAGDKLLTKFPTFQSSSPVTRLELHDYRMVTFSRADFLRLPPNLTELSMCRNGLEVLENATFTSPTPLQLRLLDLSGNGLRYFVGGAGLENLRVLDLSSNHLQQVYGLTLLQSLESVNLRDNGISYLQPSTFQGLRYLQYVNLDGNNLGSMDPSTFSNLPALAHLILSSNPLTSLGTGLYWNSRVQFVDLSHVGLTSIPPSLTKTVRDFRCTNNNLTLIRQSDFESYPNVGLLVLDENEISDVEDDAFGRLDFLTTLWMNGNRLSRVPQSLPPSLQSLHLEDNRIPTLSSSDFNHLKNLQELNLHGNRITSLSPFVFGELPNLRNLDLRSNLIDAVYRDSFASLDKLETLDLSQNPIKVIVTGGFNSLGRLSLLHLSRLMEPVECDPSSLFPPLGKLQVLELQDSPHLAQKVIETQALVRLPSLVELNLQRCELKNLGEVMRGVGETGLRALKLEGNPWDCRDLTGDLTNRTIIVDEAECEVPSNVKGARISSLNLSLLSPTTTAVPVDEEEEEVSLVDMGVLPELSDDQDEALDAPGSNSPENGAHGDANPLIISPKSTPSPQTERTGGEEETGKGRALGQGTTAQVPAGSWDGGDGAATRSYFEGPPDKTKTNDDNPIIDEGGDGGDRKRAKSIDGFPSGPTSVRDGVASGDRKGPRAFYLRRGGGSGQANSSSSDIILRTILISATSCLVSALCLLSLSWAVYKVSRRRPPSILCRGLRRRDGGDPDHTHSFSYQRFGLTSGGVERDSDQVELSGIRNRVYVENEEIYHIT